MFGFDKIVAPLDFLDSDIVGSGVLLVNKLLLKLSECKQVELDGTF